MNTISLKDVLQRLFSGEKATITVVKCDTTRNKGGQLREYCSSSLNFIAEKNDIKPHQATNFDLPTGNRNIPIYRPKPYLNMIIANGEIKKIYRVLIVKFNDKIVRI